ncbi:modulator of macroautophagy TMEM150B [Balaenoptera acutorostrata]|uniref:Modulator of macroautophagy TMEM150B n=1 Tax=Balaenoptera acutorostrata TaxID=9767 RepID=A0ABM3SIQ0_BALAC|nr:modulator of macroautophagy TMEM150B [Balaenoptera acutorostrata]
MWGYLSLLPAFLAFWATAGIWTVFSLAVANKAVNLTEGFPYISRCGNSPPQSCIFSQVLNLGAALAAWTCILRYQQLRDWGVGKWPLKLLHPRDLSILRKPGRPATLLQNSSGASVSGKLRYL